MSGESQGQRVLVVDDDPAIVELITTRLDLAGYRTFSARNGHQGISRITEVLPAVLVLDINMPGLDGFEVLKRLGRSGHLSRLPTMVLTARNRPEDVQRAVKLGAFIGFDRQGGQGDAPVVSMAASLVAQGYADHLMFASDFSSPRDLKRNGGGGYAKTLTVFVPKLKAAGVPDEALHKIMYDNPRRFLAFVPKIKRAG